MDNLNATRMTLIAKLKDRQDGRAWKEFVEIYMPVVYRFVVRSGVQDADAADVTQDVFRSVARSIDGFQCERSKGSFRGWLMTVTRSRLSDFRARRGREVHGSGDTGVHEHIEQISASTDGEAAWEQDYRQSVFRWAADQIRDHFKQSTWSAFWQTCVEGKDTKTVAQSLGISEGAVYIAKCRVTARLKEAIREYED